MKQSNKMVEHNVSKIKAHTLMSDFPDIIEKYWDYEKNIIKPENVEINSEQLYWWKDETGNFQLKPIELTKKQFGTSFHEQCILFYLKNIFNNVQSRYKIKINNVNTESDIFLLDYNIAIEYDGVFWHKDKEVQDIEKNKKIK